MLLMGLASITAFTFAQGASGQSSRPADSEPARATLAVGDKAPDFSLPLPETQGGEAGQTVTLKDYLGKKNLLLAFYPKANTPGCTTQMCGYRDDWSTFEDNETAVIAISTDKQTSSDKFKEKYSLPMLVLGDPEREIIDAYGVKMNKLFKSAQRSVVLIDKQGVVRYVNYNYKIKDDKETLYQKIKEVTDERK